MSFTRTVSVSIDSSPSRRNSALKPISRASAANPRRHALARLADVLRPRRDGELTLGEPKAKRRVPLREQADPANDVEELVAGKLELVLELLGEELLVVRELAVDPPARQPHAAGPEHDVVLLHGELHRLGAATDPRELLERSRRDDRLELGQRAGKRGLLDGQPVGVRRGHDELARLEAHEDARENRAALVARRRATDPRDGLEEHLGVHLLQRYGVEVRAGSGSPRRHRCGCGTSRAPLVITSTDSSGRCSSVTSGSGSARAMSRSSRPGTTTVPSPATSASTEARSESSMSVAASSSFPFAVRSCIPPSTSTDARVDRARETTRDALGELLARKGAFNRSTVTVSESIMNFKTRCSDKGGDRRENPRRLACGGHSGCGIGRGPSPPDRQAAMVSAPASLEL